MNHKTGQQQAKDWQKRNRNDQTNTEQVRTLGKQSSEKTEQEIGDRTGTKAKERDSNINKKRSEKDEQKKASSFSLSLSLKNK